LISLTDMELRRTVEKLVRYASHRDFLLECCREGIVPNGFNLKWNLAIDAEEEIIKKCEKVKTDASLKLIELVVKACETKVNTLEKEIQGNLILLTIKVTNSRNNT